MATAAPKRYSNLGHFVSRNQWRADDNQPSLPKQYLTLAASAWSKSHWSLAQSKHMIGFSYSRSRTSWRHSTPVPKSIIANFRATNVTSSLQVPRMSTRRSCGRKSKSYLNWPSDTSLPNVGSSYFQKTESWIDQSPGRSAPDLPRKPCSVLGFSGIVDARVRVARLRFSRENRAWFLSSMLGSAQVRAGFAEKTLLRAV